MEFREGEEMNEIYFQLIDKQTWPTSLKKGANKHILTRIVVHNKVGEVQYAIFTPQEIAFII